MTTPSSPARFYFFDLATRTELRDHPLNGSAFEGTGAWVDYSDTRLRARDEIYVGRGTRVTAADFDGRAVGVKLWFPPDADRPAEKFFLVPEAA